MDNYAILKIYDIDNAVWSRKMTKFMKVVIYFKQMRYINALFNVYFYIRSLFKPLVINAFNKYVVIHSTWCSQTSKN